MKKEIDLDPEFIQVFLANRGVTAEDVENAFNLISKDGRKITSLDVKSFADKYFTKLNPNVTKFLSKWKEDIALEGLTNILLNKPMASTPFEEAFEWFHMDGNQELDFHLIQETIKMTSPYKMVLTFLFININY